MATGGKRSALSGSVDADKDEEMEEEFLVSSLHLTHASETVIVTVAVPLVLASLWLP